MGKLEKFGRSILKKLGSGRNQTRRRAGTAISSSSSTSSDEETSNYVHTFQVVPPEDQVPSSTSPDSSTSPEEVRIASPAASDEGSAGYATDDTALSSLSPLDVKRVSVDYSESQGYYSTAELSPIPRIVEPEPPQEVPRIVVTPTVIHAPRYLKNPSQEYPRVNVSNRLLKKMSQSSHGLDETSNLEIPMVPIGKKIPERSATLSNLKEAVESEDPIERFLKSSIYKTKMITTVFEAKDKGIEEIYEDVVHEIDRWFEAKNMMAVACEMHWSVPREKRSRQLESKLKEKLLNALRENNKRLLYLRGMGKSTSPVKLAESKTVENISRERETDSVRGIYQRSYTRLLPYLHKETPEWHSQYWTLQDLQNDEPMSSSRTTLSPVQPAPENFLFNSEPPEVLAKNSLISLNIIGLSILGNSRKSYGSLFLS